jgi:signal transduction histidine kinase
MQPWGWRAAYQEGLCRALTFNVYLALVAAATVALNVWDRPFDISHPDDLIQVGYLFIASIALNLADVRLDRGHLTLGALALGVTTILTNPLDATIIGLAIAFGQLHRGTRAALANAVFYSAIACLAATVAAELRLANSLSFGSRIVVLLTLGLANLIVIAVGLSLMGGESVRNVARANFAPAFFLALAYMGLAALLASYVLDGTLLGYVLASAVFVLALALTDTIAGRRVRQVLEAELSDADRHLFHSRAVEGVVHNLRNHMANALGYLREIDSRRLDPVDRESLETATAAANDAVTVLRGLSQGATPRVTFATEPIDLNELVTRALGMARPRARSKEVQLAVRETPEVVKVRADPLLLREVITNLLNNAIDAVGQGGRVEATTGKRGNGWPYLSVADNGPGVSDDQRHHLFEPHFTTKEGGTGLGLFMSYGIVREHQGQLLFEGSRRGAIFSVVLPPFGG